MQRATAQSLVDKTKMLVQHFEPLLMALEPAPLPNNRPSGLQGGSDSLADTLRHQQLLLDVAESSGKQKIPPFVLEYRPLS